jgi:protein SCO1
MPKRAMNKKNPILFAVTASIALALSSCSANAPSLPPPLEGAKIGGPFTLTDQTGKPRSYDEFAGKYRIVYFGYTSCPDICTPDMQNLMAGLKKFEKDAPALGAKIQPLFITVDPARDTPAILKQFVSAFHPRLIGLTGSEADIADAAKKFAIYFNKEPSKSADSYIMSHSQTPYLMGPDGKPIALLPADGPQSPANEGSPDLVAAELAKWVK